MSHYLIHHQYLKKLLSCRFNKRIIYTIKINNKTINNKNHVSGHNKEMIKHFNKAITVFALLISCEKILHEIINVIKKHTKYKIIIPNIFTHFLLKSYNIYDMFVLEHV